MLSSVTNLRAAIFDMDGTLVDNMKYHVAAWIELFRDEGLAVTVEDYYQSGVGGAAEDVVRQFLGNDLPDAQVKTLVAQKEFLYRYLIRREIKPIRGLRRFLAEGRNAGIPMAVATAAGKKNTDFILSSLGVQAFFSVVVTAADVRRGKPEPDMFLEAAERLGVSPRECLVFEDSYAGLEAAKRAGMRAVAVATTHALDELAQVPGVCSAVENYQANFLPQMIQELG